MNREQFMSRLDKSLGGLKYDVRHEILRDFEEHFEIGAEQGKSEEEIAQSLGSPHQIAKELTAVHYLERAEATTSAGNIMRAAWAAIGLGFFNLVIVLGPFIAVAAIVFAGWTIGISFVATPVLAIIGMFIYADDYAVFQLFASLALSGLGLLILYGMLYVSRWVLKGFVKYLRYNIRLVKGGLQHE